MHPSRHPTKAIAVFAASLLPTLIATAQVPETIHYQGKVTVSGQAFTGTGSFKFALIDGGTENVSTAVITANVNDGAITSYNIVDAGSGYITAPTLTISGGGGAGATAVAVVENGEVTAVNRVDFGDNYTSTPTVTVSAPPPATLESLWSHDGSSSGGSEPTTAIGLPVSNGIFSVNLGDVAIAGMVEPISAELLAGGAQRLRVWFDDGFGAFELLSPDQKLASVPYALVAESAQSVADGAVSFDQVDPGIALWSQDITTGAIEYFVHQDQGITVTPFTDPEITQEFWSPMIAMGHGNNVASARGATVAGGGHFLAPNTASGDFSTVGGGFANSAFGPSATVGGGSENFAFAHNSFIGGGGKNSASGIFSFIGGGTVNQASGAFSTSVGGLFNNVTGDYSTVGGGQGNSAIGDYSAVPGGLSNSARGDHSFAAGRRAKVGENHHGTFVWADQTDADFSSTGTNQFLIRAGGGVGINTNAPATALHISGLTTLNSMRDGLRLQSLADNTWDIHFGSTSLAFAYNNVNRAFLNSDTGAWTTSSDARLKTEITPIDSVLADLQGLEVVSYHYKNGERLDHPQIGFLAQNVETVFPHLTMRGSEDDYWSLNYAGFSVLAIRAIQEQQKIIESQDSRISDQDARIAELEAQLAGQTELESRLSHLEDVLAGAELVSTSD